MTVSVCPRAYLRNDLRKNFCACYTCSWLGPSGSVWMCYILPVLLLLFVITVAVTCDKRV